MYTIVSKKGCPFCVSAIELAKDKGLPYDVHLLETPEQIATFKALGFRTVPQIRSNVSPIGGYEEFVAYLEGKNK